MTGPCAEMMWKEKPTRKIANSARFILLTVYKVSKCGYNNFCNSKKENGYCVMVV